MGTLVEIDSSDTALQYPRPHENECPQNSDQSKRFGNSSMSSPSQFRNEGVCNMDSETSVSYDPS